RDGQRLVVGVGVGVILAAISTTIPGSSGFSWAFLATFAIATIAALIVERGIVDAVVHAAYARGIGLRRALIVARAHEYKDILSSIAPHHSGRPAEDQVIVGYVTPDVSRDESELATLA